MITVQYRIRKLIGTVCDKKLLLAVLALLVTFVLALPLHASADPEVDEADAYATEEAQPRIPATPASDQAVLQISTGVSYTLALRADGTIWSWGSQATGRLGLGTTTSQSVPQMITGGADSYSYIFAGNGSSFAIDTDGNLWAWGNGQSGQLGLGTFNNRLTPYMVSGGPASWQHIATGSDYTVGLGTDGTLWAWGNGADGRLGLGNNTSHSTPQQITGGAASWEAVSTGGTSNPFPPRTFALDSDGNLWRWGGTGVNASPVLQTGGATPWQDISVSEGHILLIGNNGSLWAGGRNVTGELGRGSYLSTDWNLPIQEITLGDGQAPWQAISARSGQSWAVDANGDTYVFGNREGLGSDAFPQFPGNIHTPAPFAGVIGGTVTNPLGVVENPVTQPTQIVLPGAVTNPWTPPLLPGPTPWTIATSSGRDGAVPGALIGSDGSPWIWGGTNQHGQLGKAIIGRTSNYTQNPQARSSNNFHPWRIAASTMPNTTGATDSWLPMSEFPSTHTSPAGVGSVVHANHVTVPGHRMRYWTNANVPAWTDAQLLVSNIPTGAPGRPAGAGTYVPEVIIRFDRPMRTDQASRGHIIIDNGATVDVAAGQFFDTTRGPNTEFRAPLTLTTPHTEHSAVVFGFVDAQFGMRGTNEMYPHGTRTMSATHPLRDASNPLFQEFQDAYGAIPANAYPNTSWLFRTGDLLVSRDVEVTKTVEGRYANLGQRFTFDLVLGGTGVPTPITANVYRGTNTTPERTVTITNGATPSAGFFLYDNERLVIRNLPVGVTFQATERAHEGWRADLAVELAGVEVHTAQAGFNTALSSGTARALTSAEGRNAVDFTNHPDTPPPGTGLGIIDNTSVVLIVASAVALTVLVGVRNARGRRKAEEAVRT